LGIRASEGGDLVWAGRGRDEADGLSVARLAYRRLGRGRDGLTLASYLAGVIGLVPLVPALEAAGGPGSDPISVLAFQVAEAAVVTLALGLVVMAAGHYAGGQRQELALASARGWSFGAIWRLLLLQYGVLAVLALPVGLAVAALTLAATAVVVDGPGVVAQASAPLLGQLVGPGVALVAVAAGSALALVTSAAGAARRAQAEGPLAPRPPSLWWRRAGLDLALALIGLVGLLLLGGARMTGALVLPSSALAALLMAAALLAVPATLRLQPPASWLAIHTCRGMPAILVGAELRRHSSQHLGAALLVALAVLAATCASAGGFTLFAGQLPGALWSGADAGLLAVFVAALIGLPASLALHFGAAVRRRRRDYLALSIQGLSARTLISAVAVEQVAVLSGGVVAGTLLGLALCWATLPGMPRSAALLAGLTMAGVWILTAMAGRVWLRGGDRQALARQLRQPA
jgi:hypothetical protein